MLCTEDDQVALHRLNWQRLWVIQPDASVCSATWSSDGKMLAIGGTDGRIALVDSEQGDMTRLHAGLPDAAQPITDMHWQDVRAADQHTTQRPVTMATRLQHVCSPPPPPTPPPGYQRPSPYAPPPQGMCRSADTTAHNNSCATVRWCICARVASIAHLLGSCLPHFVAVHAHAPAAHHRRVSTGIHAPHPRLHVRRGPHQGTVARWLM